MYLRKSPLRAELFALMLLLGAPMLAEGQTTPPRRVELSPCKVRGISEDARCGKYSVPENRASGKGRRIDLNIVILPAQTAGAALDPLVFLAGGPGQAAGNMADSAAQMFAGVRGKRDIVLIDQRGTGKSNPLNCNLYGPELQSFFDDLFPTQAVRQCWNELKERADLTQYSTATAMADLDEVREALGYNQINIYGTSYGTMAAQTYLALYPERVRTMILKAIVPIDQARKLGLLTYAQDSQESLTSLFAECSSNAVCAKAFPDLRKDFERVLASFNAGPVKVMLKNPSTGQSDQILISREAFVGSIMSALQSASSSRQVPLLIHRAAAEDFAPLASAILLLRRFVSTQLSVGMHLSVMCAEANPVVNDREVTLRSAGTFLGDVRFRGLQRACREWPVGPSQPISHRSAPAPILLLSGSTDPNTPARGGEYLAKRFRNSRHVVLNNVAHSINGSAGCADVFMAQFIEKGSLLGLDTSCASGIPPQPFVVQ